MPSNSNSYQAGEGDGGVNKHLCCISIGLGGDRAEASSILLHSSDYTIRTQSEDIPIERGGGGGGRKYTAVVQLLAFKIHLIIV